MPTPKRPREELSLSLHGDAEVISRLFPGLQLFHEVRFTLEAASVGPIDLVGTYDALSGTRKPGREDGARTLRLTFHVQEERPIEAEEIRETFPRPAGDGRSGTFCFLNSEIDPVTPQDAAERRPVYSESATTVRAGRTLSGACGPQVGTAHSIRIIPGRADEVEVCCPTATIRGTGPDDPFSRGVR